MQPTSTDPYETAAPNAYEWTEKAYDLLVEKRLTATVAAASGVRSAVVAGPCPRCGHSMKYEHAIDIVHGEGHRTLGKARQEPAEDQYVPLTVPCACGEPHQGRPDGVGFGCGINFRLDVLSP